MTRARVDVLIAGGGLAGLMAASAFGRAGFRVLLVDPAPPVTEVAAEGSDLRSTAFLQPARTFLEQAGLWDALADHAVPLQSLRIVDTAGTPPAVRESRMFQASDLGDGPFGWNLPNWLIRREVLAQLRDRPEIELELGTGVDAILSRTNEAIVTLRNAEGTERRVGARLVIGADGRASPVRGAAGIGVDVKRYGQKALALAASHALPHDNVSTEIYHRGGAFTTVPLPDHDGNPASAIVWMNVGARAQELAAMPDKEFDAAMTGRACGLLGQMHAITGRRVWPVVTQRALRLTGERIALVAEAAHVLPPIGAQGLNTSLQDVAALCDLARAAPERLGDAAMLDAYETARGRDIAARARAIDAFNRICKSGVPAVQALRRAGLRTVYDLAPVRQGLMRAGMGPPPPEWSSPAR